ncbi:MAG: hypothetical protein ACI9Z3_000812 [Roseivirga sp.]|jgi:hypothetical protein
MHLRFLVLHLTHVRLDGVENNMERVFRPNYKKLEVNIEFG